MIKKINKEEILDYQKHHSYYLKLDLYNAWKHKKSFNLRELYAQWLVYSYIECIEIPRVRKNPKSIDLELYDAKTKKHFCSRLGILSK